VPKWMTPIVGARYLYGWNRMGRKGQLCMVTVWAPKFDTVGVQFEDGYAAITSAKALKNVPENYVRQDTLFS
jgi:hypothetical protein